MNPRLLIATSFAIVLCSCEPESLLEETNQETSAAEQLAALGKRASTGHPEIRIEGFLGEQARFTADYAPQKKTLIYELKIGEKTERFVVSPDEAVYSVTGKPDRKVNRDATMPNGKDWPYAIRMAAPFLDAIDGYTATLNSYRVENTNPPEKLEEAPSLTWFRLTPERDQIHDLMFMEFSKVSALMIGVDPKSGLLRSLYSVPKKLDQGPTEIRSKLIR